MNEKRQHVERAIGYPYAIPSRSFLLPGGDPDEAREVDPTGIDTSHRTPLLAYGSNAAPEVLARKLGESTHETPVLALRATLTDFDVVYSAHISRYGSIPAALKHSPGTEVTVFVLYLIEKQLALISATEPNYERVMLSDVSCKLEGGETLTELSAYLSRHGCLLVDGSEVALTAVEAGNRTFPAMSQREVLEHVRDILRPGESLDRFILNWTSGPLAPGVPNEISARLRGPSTKQVPDS